VAGRTGGGAVVGARRPGAGRGLEIELVAEGIVDGAVLGFLVNLDLGMVRPQVAGVAGFGPAGLGYREAVPGVAGGA
jgi:hypothetical protein